MLRLPEVYFVNDKNLYNARYRSKLIKALSSNLITREFGLFDGFKTFAQLFLRILLYRNIFLVSSNLKSNLIILMFFWVPKIVIVNGLGRYRSLKFLRGLVRLLLVWQSHRAKIFIQNYADYRFFRRYSGCTTKIVWMQGSGGVKRKLGKNKSSMAVITRDEKLLAQRASIIEFYKLFWEPKKIVLVGVKDFSSFNFERLNIQSKGYVDQSKIMSFSRCLLVPSGYGEGIPHTLVDAIVSGAEIYLTRKNFVSYGFHKSAKYQKISETGKWVRLIITQSLKEALSEENIVNQFKNEIDKLIYSKNKRFV